MPFDNIMFRLKYCVIHCNNTGSPAILYALMDLRAKSDVVHGFALGTSVSTYD
jgi:hypothetical protein